MTTLVDAVAVTALLSIASSVHAETYPSRPVAFVVPFAAGSATDTITRVVAQNLSVSLKQNVVVEKTSQHHRQ